jgi:hypothetical protein
MVVQLHRRGARTTEKKIWWAKKVGEPTFLHLPEARKWFHARIYNVTRAYTPEVSFKATSIRHKEHHELVSCFTLHSIFLSVLFMSFVLYDQTKCPLNLCIYD